MSADGRQRSLQPHSTPASAIRKQDVREGRKWLRSLFIRHACPIKRRKRRGRAEIEKIKEAIYRFTKREKPVTVRQVFYHLTTLGLVGKTEGEYQNTVVRLMSQMRRERRLPFA